MLAVLALGGGTGHLLRAIAFARAAATRGHRTRILASSPFTELLARSLAPPGTAVDRAAGSEMVMRSQARAWIGAFDDEALIVDTFPRGVVGELDGAPWRCPRLLVHRDLTDAYALRREVSDAAAAFDAIVAPGESGPWATQPGARITATAPWLIAATERIEERGRARAALGVEEADRRPVVAVVTTSTDDDALALGRLGRALAEELRERVHVVVVDLHERGAPVPLARLMSGIDLVVGGGGYHLVHEARATATPLCALPAPRTYDVQSRRLRSGERARDLEDVARRIRAVSPRTAPPPSSIVDGAAEGVQVVEELVASIRADGRRSPR